MPYYNGTTGGGYSLDSGEPIPYIPTTLRYCDGCAEHVIPLRGKPGDVGRHWQSDFKWAPYYGGGLACDKCGNPLDGAGNLALASQILAKQA